MTSDAPLHINSALQDAVDEMLGSSEPVIQVVYRRGVYTIEFADGQRVTLTESEALDLYRDLKVVLDRAE